MYCSKLFHFDASHIVPEHPGICRSLHGHTWDLEVAATSNDPNPESGLSNQPLNLKHLVTPVIQRLHGQHLNYVVKIPTVENVCIYIAHILRSLDDNIRSVRLSVKSLADVVWSDENSDWEIFQSSESLGWTDAFTPIPAFASHKARAQWVAERYQLLNDHYKQMTSIGSELYAFELYKASLNPDEAAKLLRELKEFEEKKK